MNLAVRERDMGAFIAAARQAGMTLADAQHAAGVIIMQRQWRAAAQETMRGGGGVEAMKSEEALRR